VHQDRSIRINTEPRRGTLSILLRRDFAREPPPDAFQVWNHLTRRRRLVGGARYPFRDQ
jgi:hypothetical protein